MKCTSVNIACWNINCLKSKLFDKSNDSVFLKEISSFDIVCLSEIKCKMEHINFEGYRTHVVQRKTVDKGPVYGGIAILVKRNIKPGIIFLPSTSSEYQWIKLDKDFFGLTKNIYVCFVYYSPRNSTYSNSSDADIIASVGSDLSRYSSGGNILLCGDFNARTGCKVPDFIVNDNDVHVPVSNHYLEDADINCRVSQDHVTDARGRELLDLCTESQLRILNGRSFGNSQGMFTSYKYNDNSVVDYMLVSENLLSQILYFNVAVNIPRLSDHSKLSCKIMANYSTRHTVENLISFSPQYKWSSISADNFKDALCSNIVKQKIKDFENLAQSSSVDHMVSKLNDIIVTAADISLQKDQKQRQNVDYLQNGLIKSYTKCAECLIKKAICMLNFQMIHMFAAPFINLENDTLKLANVNENHINLTLLINWNSYKKLTQKHTGNF